MIRVRKDGYDWRAVCERCGDKAYMDRWDWAMEWVCGHLGFTHQRT